MLRVANTARSAILRSYMLIPLRRNIRNIGAKQRQRRDRYAQGGKIFDIKREYLNN